ncbi:MAG: methylisocitrate lyase [Parachlamydiaceae bacterium]|nr:MAG: methylisocitrate lyase [Parachlamydiaceae bacterium]
MTPGQRFREALSQHRPLQIVGTLNAYVAIMAQKVGFKAIYLSGAGVANSSYGLPDLGITTLDNVLEDVRRITEAVSLPLLVDIDTGWGSSQMIYRTIKAMIQAGAAAIHLEDQVFQKRCGHRPGKSLVSLEEMCTRIQAANESRNDWDPSFYIIARTDALSSEGLEGVIERGIAYRNAGADALFAEAFENLDEYYTVKRAVGLPLLANMTEFGRTPLFTIKELDSAHVDMILYPLSVNRAMNRAALKVLEEIYQTGSQKGMIDQMQTRNELYEFLNYEEHEKI